MLSSSEMDTLKERMKALIVRDSQVFFTDTEESENLQISVGIARILHIPAAVKRRP